MNNVMMVIEIHKMAAVKDAQSSVEMVFGMELRNAMMVMM